MNFSNRLAGLLYMLQSVSSVYPGLSRPDSVSKTYCFNLVYSVIKLRLVTPVLFGIAKVENFLLLSSFFLKLFFFPFLRPNPKNKKRHFLSHNLSKSTFSLSFSSFSSSEAGCKSRKNINTRKH